MLRISPNFSDMSENLKKLVHYVLELGRYDMNTDVRDRVRFLRGIVASPDLAKMIYSGQKPEPNLPLLKTYDERFEWGSLSIVVGLDVLPHRRVRR